MEDLLSEFSPPSYDTWLALVEKEIKRKAESTQLDKVVYANPFINPFEKPKGFQPINLENIPKIIFEEFKESNNTQIQHSLQGGITGLSIEFNDDVDFNQLFHGIDLSFLFLRVVCKSQPELQKLDSFLMESYNDQKIKVLLKTDSINIDFKSFDYEFEIEVPDSDNSYEDLLEAILKFEEKGIQNNVPCFFKISSKENFFLNIARIKTLRLLTKAISQAYKLNSTPTNILCDLKCESENPNLAIISLTQQFVSSISAGANMFLPIAPTFVEDSEGLFARRITRNIFHLLQHESYMFRNDDPVAGSYIIDDMCEKLYNQVWSKFKELKSIH